MPEDTPTDTPAHPHSSGSRTLMMLAGLAILLTAMKLAASFFVPVVIALFLAVLSYPLVRWLLRRGLPHFIAIILTVLVIVALFGWAQSR